MAFREQEKLEIKQVIGETLNEIFVSFNSLDNPEIVLENIRIAIGDNLIEIQKAKAIADHKKFMAENHPDGIEPTF